MKIDIKKYQSQQSDGNKRNGKGVVNGFIYGTITVLLMVFIIFPKLVIGGNIAERVLNSISGNGNMVVGTDIAMEDITEFYYTYATSTNPPDYQRYRFFVDNGTYWFYHEKREGDHWPLTEKDITVSGSVNLSEDQWTAFFSLLKGGQVKRRKESVTSGGSGPWLYLYWKGDRSEYQEFSFVSWSAKKSFEEFCVKLKN